MRRRHASALVLRHDDAQKLCRAAQWKRGAALPEHCQIATTCISGPLRN